MKSSRVISIFLLLLAAGLSPADVPEAQRPEVQHLLETIKTSACIMERNDEKGTGAMAHDHILRKYDYYRDEIQSTEDFIELAATKSVLSGKYYYVHCEGQPAMRLKDWLLFELQRYRVATGERN